VPSTYLTVDSTPTQSSSHLVTSGGVYSSLTAAKSDTDPITSPGVYAVYALDTENALAIFYMPIVSISADVSIDNHASALNAADFGNITYTAADHLIHLLKNDGLTEASFKYRKLIDL